MIIYRVKLGHAVTFTKHLDCVVSLIFLPKNLIWNKIKFSSSSLLMVNELNKTQFLCYVSEVVSLNRHFYRYGGHIELIRFKEYYRMLRGHEHISFVFSSAFRDIFS